MSDLEARYRGALRWYPKTWRTTNEDAMVGTLLDIADSDSRTEPARGELTDLRISALALRAGPFGRISAPVRDRAAALAFGLVGGIAIATLVAMALQKASNPPYIVAGVPIIGPFFGWGFVYYSVLLAALVAGVIGARWAARGPP